MLMDSGVQIKCKKNKIWRSTYSPSSYPLPLTLTSFIICLIIFFLCVHHCWYNGLCYGGCPQTNFFLYPSLILNTSEFIFCQCATPWPRHPEHGHELSALGEPWSPGRGWAWLSPSSPATSWALPSLVCWLQSSSRSRLGVLALTPSPPPWSPPTLSAPGVLAGLLMWPVLTRTIPCWNSPLAFSQPIIPATFSYLSINSLYIFAS